MMNATPRSRAYATDLFGFDPDQAVSESHDRYPHHPGFKRAGTSRTAANSISVYAETKRRDVLVEFVAAGERGLTPDTCAKALNLSVLTVRPRCTELLAAGLLIPTGERRQNQSGMSAAVLKATEAGIRAANKNGGCHE
jgi:hypothetical protein